MKQSIKSLPLSTMGHCFLCLKYVEVNKKKKSLKILCRYLNVKLDQLIGSCKTLLSETTGPLENVDLRVTLCGKCNERIERISSTLKLLEVLEMELAYLVGTTQTVIAEAEANNHLRTAYQKKMKCDLASFLQIDFIDKLRSSLLKKSQKASSVGKPIVKLHKFDSISQEDSSDDDDDDLFIPIPTPRNKSVIPTNQGNQAGSLKTSLRDTTNILGGADGQRSSHLVPVDGSSDDNSNSKEIENNPNITADHQDANLSYEKLQDSGRFQCKLCPAQYSRVDVVQRHISEVHLGVKYNCDLCGNIFHTKRGLKAHVDNVHLGIKYFCTVPNCKKALHAFSSKSLVQKHLSNMHSEIEDGTDFVAKRRKIGENVFEAKTVENGEVTLDEYFIERIFGNHFLNPEPDPTTLNDVSLPDQYVCTVMDTS